MPDKIFKTCQQLLRILRNRGVNIPVGYAASRAMRVLEKENYYNVVNGYKDLFLAQLPTAITEEQYKPNTTFDEIHALYEFDREARIIYLKYILKLENHFKTVVAHHFSEQYGYRNYLKLENFQHTATAVQRELQGIARSKGWDVHRDITKINQLSVTQNLSNVNRLLGDIQHEISRQFNNNHSAITHYMRTHGYIPLWVLMNVLTFGKVTAFYSNLKPTDKDTIAREFKLTAQELHKYMSMLGLARNICAHDERFFSIRFRFKLHTKSIRKFNVLQLPREPHSNSYIQGIGDAYALAIIFAQLLPKSDIREFISSMERAFKKLDKKISTVSLSDVQTKMGYHSSWKNLVDLY